MIRKKSGKRSNRKKEPAAPKVSKPWQPSEEKPVNQGRHESHCSICCHPKRDEIEDAFVSWISPVRISADYSVTRDSVYRHAHALGLMEKRRRNVRSALERIIEKAGEVKVNAAAVVSAIGTYARINSRGEMVERTEAVNLNALFERMTLTELDAYAKEGALPDWFENAVPATGVDSQEGSNAR